MAKKKIAASDGKRRGTPTRGADVLVPQKHGGALLAGGKVGHKGGSGRPPADELAWERKMLKRVQTRKRLRRLLREADYPVFLKAYGMLDNRVRGLPKAPVEHDVKEGLASLLMGADEEHRNA